MFVLWKDKNEKVGLLLISIIFIIYISWPDALDEIIDENINKKGLPISSKYIITNPIYGICLGESLNSIKRKNISLSYIDKSYDDDYPSEKYRIYVGRELKSVIISTIKVNTPIDGTSKYLLLDIIYKINIIFQNNDYVYYDTIRSDLGKKYTKIDGGILNDNVFIYNGGYRKKMVIDLDNVFVLSLSYTHEFLEQFADKKYEDIKEKKANSIIKQL